MPPVPPKKALLFPLTHAVLGPASSGRIPVRDRRVPRAGSAVGVRRRVPVIDRPAVPMEVLRRPPGRRRDQAVGRAAGAGRPKLGPAHADSGSACSATLPAPLACWPRLLAAACSISHKHPTVELRCAAELTVQHRTRLPSRYRNAREFHWSLSNETGEVLSRQTSSVARANEARREPHPDVPEWLLGSYRRHSTCGPLYRAISLGRIPRLTETRAK